MVAIFVHAICRRSKKYLMQKVGNFGSLGPIPVIQPPYSIALVLLYIMSLEQSFSIEWFQSYTKLKIGAKFHFNT